MASEGRLTIPSSAETETGLIETASKPRGARKPRGGTARRQKSPLGLPEAEQAVTLARRSEAARGDWTAHETAVIDAGARIGAGTRIWHFCHVCAKAEIGASCSLGQNVFVANNVRVGNHVKIQNNVSLYEGVILEDYVFCGPSMVFTNVRTPRSAYPRNTTEDYAPTLVRTGASIGANATVVCGRTIHPWAFVAAGAVVTRDVPAYALVAGVPARVIGWVCECGVTLDFDEDTATCKECKKVYLQDRPEEIRRVS